MIIEDKCELTKLGKAKKIFNRLLNSGEIVSLINSMRPLDLEYTNVSKPFILDHLTLFKNVRVTVGLYKPMYWRSKAYARTFTGNFSLIELSSRRLNRTVASITGSIGHEWGHLLEFYAKHVTHNTTIKFNHGDNSPVGKEDTFQYQLGKAVKRYVEDNLEELLREIEGR